MADTVFDVVEKAMSDPDFLKVLLKSVDAALESYGLHLSDGDREALKNAIEHPPTSATIDLPRFLDEVHRRGFHQIQQWILWI